MFYDDVYRALDSTASSWQRITHHAGWPARRSPTVISFQNTIYVMGGYGQSGGTGFAYNDVYSSTNGLTWNTITTQAGWEPRYWASAVVHNNTVFLLAGCSFNATNGGYQNDVWSSTNPSNPSPSAWRFHGYAPWDARCSAGIGLLSAVGVVIWGGNTADIEGESSRVTNDVWTSTDPTQLNRWVRRTSNPAWSLYPRFNFAYASFGGSLFMIGGAGLPVPEVWHASGDGSQWVSDTGAAAPIWTASYRGSSAITVLYPTNSPTQQQLIVSGGLDNSNLYTNKTYRLSDVNECANSNGGCSTLATCVNTFASRTCNCPSGYSSPDGVLCLNINECATNNGGCATSPVTALCTDAIGNYSCTCPTGWSSTDGGVPSQDVNECASSNGGCLHAGICSNTIGSRACDCTGTGYTGASCETNINECATGNGGCLNNGFCNDLSPFRSCDCTGTGYSGSVCETNVNECATANGGCLNGAICADTIGSVPIVPVTSVAVTVRPVILETLRLCHKSALI